MRIVLTLLSGLLFIALGGGLTLHATGQLVLLGLVIAVIGVICLYLAFQL